MSPRLILLSDHGAHSQRIARIIAARGVKLDAVVVHQGGRPRDLSRALWNRGPIWALRLRVAFERHQKSFYAPLQTRVLPTGTMNSAAMLGLMQRLAPDYILLGTTKIVGAPIIETAKCGVINVHPALLPWTRGSGVVGHALQNGVPLGATLHFIDAGIDTGAIIERRLLPVTEHSLTLAQLEAAADELGARLMADVVETLVKTGEKPVATPQSARHPLFRWPGARSARAHELAAAGRAFELFEKWKSQSLGAPNWVLPPDGMEANFEADVAD